MDFLTGAAYLRWKMYTNIKLGVEGWDWGWGVGY